MKNPMVPGDRRMIIERRGLGGERIFACILMGSVSDPPSLGH